MSQDLNGCGGLTDWKGHTARTLLLGSQAVSDLLTLAGRDRETPPWNNDLLLWDIFQKAFGLSTLPDMPNNPIRNYYPLFSVKQG